MAALKLRGWRSLIYEFLAGGDVGRTQLGKMLEAFWPWMGIDLSQGIWCEQSRKIHYQWRLRAQKYWLSLIYWRWLFVFPMGDLQGILLNLIQVFGGAMDPRENFYPKMMIG